MTPSITRRALLAFSLVLSIGLSGCATLSDMLEPPKVSLTNIQMLETNGLSARFLVDLRVTNPNPVPVPVSGLSYELALNGNRVLDGVANSIGDLSAYGEADVQLEVGTNLTGLMSLAAQLFSSQSRSFDYELITQVGVRGFSRPFTVVDAGQIDLAR